MLNDKLKNLNDDFAQIIGCGKGERIRYLENLATSIIINTLEKDGHNLSLEVQLYYNYKSLNEQIEVISKNDYTQECLDDLEVYYKLEAL